MAIRKVLKMGEPSLLERSVEWRDFDTAELKVLLQDHVGYDGSGERCRVSGPSDRDQ